MMEIGCKFYIIYTSPSQSLQGGYGVSRALLNSPPSPSLGSLIQTEVGHGMISAEFNEQLHRSVGSSIEM
jgi:hypothetical protein